ncbi:hypothetical protein SKAU_G00312960 [Synaphobranchus kaupii]|uniref:Uncharacterized protein n=1 Tax=Synaphobranchus kaupii TaxID=118154 RepID=A0A9Q1ES51_SYNKA|nr:hypothetical protein SKAU_G00312960 [Synaphobranchus kaupii]
MPPQARSRFSLRFPRGSAHRAAASGHRKPQQLAGLSDRGVAFNTERVIIFNCPHWILARRMWNIWI